MFDQDHQVGFSNCRDLVRVLYSDLDLSHLPPYGMHVAKFIIEILENLKLHQDTRSDTSCRSHHGESSQKKDAPGGLGTAKDQSSIMKPINPVDKGDQSIKMESWGNSNVQQVPRMVVTSSEANKDQPLARISFCFFFIFCNYPFVALEHFVRKQKIFYSYFLILFVCLSYITFFLFRSIKGPQDFN